MKGIAKAVLYSILISTALLLFSNLVFFFPWYITLVVETFNVSQMVSTDNYLRESYYNDTIDRIQARPIFKEHPDLVEIIVTNSSNSTGLGYDDASYYYDLSTLDKPYRQRGETITVEMKAVYPFQITLWGTKYERTMDVAFKMQTTGLKLYKDLDFY